MRRVAREVGDLWKGRAHTATNSVPEDMHTVETVGYEGAAINQLRAPRAHGYTFPEKRLHSRGKCTTLRYLRCLCGSCAVNPAVKCVRSLGNII